MKGREKEVSKLLSYILRHAPESAGITLQPGGWVEVDTLLSHIAIAPPVSRAELDEVVANNSKR
ncbi:MAG: RNA 2'-phosphotransferase [Verrucomicrobiales bacterium]|nr:RNA 2'-phosphotransferase [Verrucomicrobiales bacterium]